MWLLNTSSLELKEFFHVRPAYAILSHTWGHEEVSFREIRGDVALIRHKAGYKKIKECCDKARENYYQWVWVDTCCIDKSSSAELSEAINSMFQWYHQARVCYVYLVDVPHLSYALFLAFRNLKNASNDQVLTFETEKQTFMKSRWFTRGWTLQELLAPRQVDFFASDWSYIGSKEKLAGLIQKRTGISKLALQNDSLQGFPVRTKMQCEWAVGRETTRAEDLAYCLLGIFDINMPLLYGEGNHAFRRLQEEILKSAVDYSLLAWASFRTSVEAEACHGSAFATEPNDFAPVTIDGQCLVSSRNGKVKSTFKVLKAKVHAADDSQSRVPESQNLMDNTVLDTEHFLLRRQRRRGIVFPPPSMSSRGILITLLTNAASGEALHQNQWLAWTLLCIHLGEQSYGICVSLHEEGKPMGSGIMAARKQPEWLYLVPQAMLRTFKATTMYLRAVPSSTRQHWKQADKVLFPVGSERIDLNFRKRNNVTAKIQDTIPRLIFSNSAG